MSMKGKGPIDAAAIRELAHLLTETGLTEIEIEQAGQRVRVARMGAPMAVQHAVTAPVAATIPAADTAKKDGPAAGAVTSPMVGTVYISPEPGKPPFVKVGDRVKEGDTLLIVEAMKTMNPILAPRGGTITEICIHDAQPIEFGQQLVILN
jgi:acetyl-CoA carboxylase biotin carboxyl carrier protein